MWRQLKLNISKVQHPIPPVWNEQSRVLILGTMPSPKSRQTGFFYMHPQNRFWSVMSKVFEEEFVFPNKDLGGGATEATITAAITERRAFLLRHKLAMWDVLASCKIDGAADSSIRDAVPNNFTSLFDGSQISEVFCTGKTAYNLWKKYCTGKYEQRYNLTVHCLPSTSPANAQWKIEKLVEAYQILNCRIP
ncbi:MAG: uracil-DNA glycosylase family protein [Treponema sp.]|nr:uracil-DNA glycosylase family protein [Treponema sp.]